MVDSVQVQRREADQPMEGHTQNKLFNLLANNFIRVHVVTVNCVLIIFYNIFPVRLLFRAHPISPDSPSSYLTRSPAVWSSSKISNEFLHSPAP